MSLILKVFFSVNRWKGENVATTEVADVITLADCIREANVYGVKVAGNVNSWTRNIHMSVNHCLCLCVN